METHEIGSKIKINGKEFEIIDLWEGDSLISHDEMKADPEIFFANLKGSDGKIIGPVQLNLKK